VYGAPRERLSARGAIAAPLPPPLSPPPLPQQPQQQPPLPPASLGFTSPIRAWHGDLMPEELLADVSQSRQPTPARVRQAARGVGDASVVLSTASALSAQLAAGASGLEATLTAAERAPRRVLARGATPSRVQSAKRRPPSGAAAAAASATRVRPSSARAGPLHAPQPYMGVADVWTLPLALLGNGIAALQHFPRDALGHAPPHGFSSHPLSADS
jgi:hypothetical protein